MIIIEYKDNSYPFYNVNISQSKLICRLTIHDFFELYLRIICPVTNGESLYKDVYVG